MSSGCVYHPAAYPVYVPPLRGALQLNKELDWLNLKSVLELNPKELI